MTSQIAFIGTGHIAEYMLKGFARANVPLNAVLSDPDPKRRSDLAATYGCATATTNQEAADLADIIILAVRPQDLETALSTVEFKEGQILASVVAGADIAQLTALVAPARAVRVLPISCVAINQSPILIHPDEPAVKALFSHLGQVHLVPDETCFTPGTALVGAFYAWIFLLMEETAAWTRDQGFDPDTARQLVIQTIEGACGMANHQHPMDLGQIWQTLATPGGISEHGARVLNEKGCIHAWSQALTAITRKMEEA